MAVYIFTFGWVRSMWNSATSLAMMGQSNSRVVVTGFADVERIGRVTFVVSEGDQSGENRRLGIPYHLLSPGCLRRIRLAEQ
jgi:hypothetical protein